MRHVASILVLGLIVLALGGGVSALGGGGLLAQDASADEPAANESDQGRALAAAFEALKIRIEARMREAELLVKAGRTEEALAAYRSVGALYDEEVERIHALFQPAPAPDFDEPFDGPAPVDRPIVSPGPGRGLAEPSRWSKERRIEAAEHAIMDGLRWLKAHQAPNGSWDPVTFGAWCDGKTNPGSRPDGVGKGSYTVGVTGLALLSFLGAGYTDRGKHPFADTVKSGLRYLKSVQDPEGCFGARSVPSYVYNHAMAALAVVECVGLTGSPLLRGPAQRALDFSQMARNPYFGWRYGVKPGDNDTSVTHWMLLGIHAARLQNDAAVADGKPAPFVIDEAAYDGARAWIDKMTDPDYGRVGYITRGSGPARPKEMLDRFPSEKSESMTAAGVHIRIMAGEDPRRSAMIERGAQLMGKLPPVWNPEDGSIDMYYWFLGTMALSQIGGKQWANWKSHLLDAAVPSQRADADYCGYRGSWDPIGPWGPDGGRVYSTTLMILSLNTWLSAERSGTR